MVTEKKKKKKDRKLPRFEVGLSCKSNNSRLNLWGCKTVKVEPASKASCKHYLTDFKTV